MNPAEMDRIRTASDIQKLRTGSNTMTSATVAPHNAHSVINSPRSEVGVLDGSEMAHLSADVEVESDVDGHEDERDEAAEPCKQGGDAAQEK